MTIRRANLDDLFRVLEIYELARQYMRENGNPSQWGAAYPSEELVRLDLERGFLHVIELADSKRPCGVFAFLPYGDLIYNNIEGKWLNDLPHAAIHRVASSGEARGILPACVDFCLSRCKNLKIDTHADNKAMQHQLRKAGFVPCGRIFLENGEERIAYQLCKV